MCWSLPCKKLQEHNAKTIDIRFLGYFASIRDFWSTVTRNTVRCGEAPCECRYAIPRAAPRAMLDLVSQLSGVLPAPFILNFSSCLLLRRSLNLNLLPGSCMLLFTAPFSAQEEEAFLQGLPTKRIPRKSTRIQPRKLRRNGPVEPIGRNIELVKRWDIEVGNGPSEVVVLQKESSQPREEIGDFTGEEIPLQIQVPKGDELGEVAGNGTGESVEAKRQSLKLLHEQGLVAERFQRRERPPTAARRATRAALSEARSAPTMGNRHSEKTGRKTKKISGSKDLLIFISISTSSSLSLPRLKKHVLGLPICMYRLLVLKLAREHAKESVPSPP
ncbi:putative inactive receptor kinase [Senna tora]|uniref:Putative inactive receptor kinase n=1 Tax=Senna tora TaxID=362788 RepID=A0A834U0N9_9FABA|nr:putative inactive receptor kinase [Senna tora]